MKPDTPVSQRANARVRARETAPAANDLAAGLADIPSANSTELMRLAGVSPFVSARASPLPARLELLKRLHARLAVDADAASSPPLRAYLLGMRGDVFAWMQELQSQLAPRIVFRHLGDAVYEIGPEGGKRKALLADSPIGARAAHLAMSGPPPAFSVFTAATDAERVLRKARSITVAWAERHGCPELATAARALRLRAGRVCYEPHPAAPVFLLS